MTKQAKKAIRLVMLSLCMLHMATSQAAETKHHKRPSVWGNWFVLGDLWRMWGAEENHAESLTSSDIALPLAEVDSGIRYAEEDRFAGIKRFGSETLLLNFADDQNRFTAGLNLGHQRSWQAGIGITRYWDEASFDLQDNRQYISFIARYSF